ncbi:MAG: DUF309 domain-containing protein [Candidatus Nanopelagicales bacterium]
MPERARDELGRPLPPGSVGVPAVPDVFRDDAESLRVAQQQLDAGRPFAAHEVLEARWKSCPPAQRQHWQGLAQAAVALTHLRRGNTTGARRLARRAIDNGAAEPDTLLFHQLQAIAEGHDQGLTVWDGDSP